MKEADRIINPQRKLFFGLFVFPLLIAVGMAVLLCSVVFLTHETQTAETLIEAIKTGAPSKRWQKAFELSNELNRSSQSIRSDAVRNEIIHILLDDTHYDEKTRSYMAIALSHFDSPQSIGALQQALNDSAEDVKIYAIWALGTLNATESAPTISSFLNYENPNLRKIAAYVLGVLEDHSAASKLRALLDDPVVDVRWNSALSLARLGDDAGWAILMQMLERDKLIQQHGLSENDAEKVMINAVKGLALLNKPETFSMLETLAKADKNLKVRQAAIEALQYQKR